MSLRSPMSLALGKGAAGGAAQHWWLQRLSAIALAPLTLWLLFSLAGLPSLGYDDVRAWLAGGWTPVWMALLIVAATWHSLLGVQVVVEDYVSGTSAKTAALLLSNFVHAIVATAALFAVLKIALQ
jgi:succinate dehydrogenase / fumarate reductase, membrane anchor subunit